MSRRDRLLRRVLRERFVVTLHDGQTFDGLLLDADDRVIEMGDAFAIDKANKVPVDGTLYVPRGQVLYMQRPGGERV
jgi:hypothetical protein